MTIIKTASIQFCKRLYFNFERENSVAPENLFLVQLEGGGGGTPVTSGIPVISKMELFVLIVNY